MITNQYTYNGDGQRVQIVDSEGTKKPIWDFENILLETDGSNSPLAAYTLEPNVYGNLVSQRRGSTTSTHLFDALGSTRKLTDSNGAVTDSYDYRAYGETYASSVTTTNVFRWIGELGYYFDVDRSAYYLRARHYSPTIARFLSQDPIGFEGSEWNLYEYVGGQCTTMVDPSGKWWWLIFIFPFIEGCRRAGAPPAPLIPDLGPDGPCDPSRNSNPCCRDDANDEHQMPNPKQLCASIISCSKCNTKHGLCQKCCERCKKIAPTPAKFDLQCKLACANLPD